MDLIFTSLSVNMDFYSLELLEKEIEGIEKKIHYFRNSLNYEPHTLYDLLKERESKSWNVLSIRASTYHMHGKNGLFNTKWISPSYKDYKLYEAVYSINGGVLNITTDPVNMGTV